MVLKSAHGRMIDGIGMLISSVLIVPILRSMGTMSSGNIINEIAKI